MENYNDKTELALEVGFNVARRLLTFFHVFTVFGRSQSPSKIGQFGREFGTLQY